MSRKHCSIRILVIRSGAIGDVVVTLPALKALREHYADAHLETMGYPQTLELLRGRYYADAVTSIDQAGMGRFYLPDSTLPDALVRYFASFDLILAYVRDPDGVFQENLRRTGAKQVLCFDPFPRPPRRIPMTHHTCEALIPLGIHAKDMKPKLHPSPSDKTFAEQFWNNHSLDDPPNQWIVALHPGSGNAAKSWPARHFVRLTRWLIRTDNAKILLVSGPADSLPVQTMLGALMGMPVLLVHGLALPQLAALLQRCNAFVGSDSGVTHMAAAVGTPTIAVFGPTDPQVWGPRGKSVHIVKIEDWNQASRAADLSAGVGKV